MTCACIKPRRLLLFVAFLSDSRFTLLSSRASQETQTGPQCLRATVITCKRRDSNCFRALFHSKNNPVDNSNLLVTSESWPINRMKHIKVAQRPNVNYFISGFYQFCVRDARHQFNSNHRQPSHFVRLQKGGDQFWWPLDDILMRQTLTFSLWLVMLMRLRMPRKQMVAKNWHQFVEQIWSKFALMDLPGAAINLLSVICSKCSNMTTW